MTYLSEIELELPGVPQGASPLTWLAGKVTESLPEGYTPLRAVVSESSRSGCRCEVTLMRAGRCSMSSNPKSMFEFESRRGENAGEFNAVLVVPTGIGAAIGGHAGDATPVAQLLGQTCDTLITHPNVVNASDINEMPANSLYVEGSVLCRLLMGTVALQPVRANRVLVVIDSHPDGIFTGLAVNAVNAARASYGLDCPRVVKLEPRLVMRSEYTGSARASGCVENLEGLFYVLDDYRDDYDAVALSSVISVPFHYHGDYFGSGGAMVNPWGGVESMLTHAISTIYDVPSAHSPMLESQEVLDMDTGIVDPRMAAEAVSITFLQSVLKGLQRSPRIISRHEAREGRNTLSVSDVSCLVIPDGCLGLPTLAALEQGIPVIAVRENTNLMKNDLEALPWRHGQFLRVDNYWEAAGVMAALKAGIAPASVRRPLSPVMVETATPRRREAASYGGADSADSG